MDELEPISASLVSILLVAFLALPVYARADPNAAAKDISGDAQPILTIPMGSFKAGAIRGFELAKANPESPEAPATESDTDKGAPPGDAESSAAALQVCNDDEDVSNDEVVLSCDRCPWILPVVALYPRRERASGTEGTVDLRFRVSSGKTVDPEVIYSDPPNVFDAAAKRGATRWRYEPAAVGSDDVVTCRVQFRLLGGK